MYNERENPLKAQQDTRGPEKQLGQSNPNQDIAR